MKLLLTSVNESSTRSKDINLTAPGIAIPRHREAKEKREASTQKVENNGVEAVLIYTVSKFDIAFS